jgi:hypothetical protein
MTWLRDAFTTDGNGVRRLDLIDIDALEWEIDRGRGAPVAELRDLLEWARWLFAVRLREVELCQQLHADSQLTGFGLQQVLRLADWQEVDADYVRVERDSGRVPRFWRLGP